MNACRTQVCGGMPCAWLILTQPYVLSTCYTLEGGWVRGIHYPEVSRAGAVAGKQLYCVYLRKGALARVPQKQTLRRNLFDHKSFILEVISGNGSSGVENFDREGKEAGKGRIIAHVSTVGEWSSLLPRDSGKQNKCLRIISPSISHGSMVAAPRPLYSFSFVLRQSLQVLWPWERAAPCRS